MNQGSPEGWRGKLTITTDRDNTLTLASVSTETKGVIGKRHQHTTVHRVMCIAVMRGCAKRGVRMLAFHGKKERADMIFCLIAYPVSVV